MVKKILASFLCFALFSAGLSYASTPQKAEAAAVAAGAGAVAAGPIGWVIGGAVVIGATLLAAEHTKGKRGSTHDKHTKSRPGRPTTKDRQKPNWQNKNGRRR